jgi:hypothetical protein
MHNIPLIKHRYVWIDDSFVAAEPLGKLIPAVWFGIMSYPGRALGCHILLDCGASVIDIPLHALRWKEDSPLVKDDNEISRSIFWDSFGWDLVIFESQYMSGLEVAIRTNDKKIADTGTAWFAVDWKDNGWSDYPSQHKWLWIIAADDGRIMAVPQDRLLFHETSFTDGEFPNGGIKRQSKVWKAE